MTTKQEGDLWLPWAVHGGHLVDCNGLAIVSFGSNSEGWSRWEFVALRVNALAGVPDETLAQLDLTQLPAVREAWTMVKKLKGTGEQKLAARKFYGRVDALCTPPKPEKEKDDER